MLRKQKQPQQSLPGISPSSSPPTPSATTPLEKINYRKKFKIGDKVAHNDPVQVSYHWQGKIVKWHSNPDMCWVEWEQRKEKDEFNRLKYRQHTITALMENLRLIA